MNKHQKEIVKAQLDDEKKVLKWLEQVYAQSQKDVQEKIAKLDLRSDSNMQHVIYQRKYQQLILNTIESNLNDLRTKQYESLQEFFTDSYNNGYCGALYDIAQQGIPVVSPIDSKKVAEAVQVDSKLSDSYYSDRLIPENVARLKMSVKAELSRSIASGSTWAEAAKKLAKGMNNPFDRAFRDAMRIVRTEGHRINQQGALDAGNEAIDAGAEVVKQWDATLDGDTRPWHQEADGQIREWNEPFDVMGEKLKAPSIGGSAKNVINCRCQLLQRARWALDEDELKELERRASFFGLDKTKDFEEYKQKYLQLPKDADKIKIKPIAAETTGGAELESIKEKLPETYKAMHEILKGVK